MKSDEIHHNLLAKKASNFLRDGAAPEGGARPVESVPPSREDIARTAYYNALARNFEPGGELEDWLAAERELNSTHAKPRHR